MFPLAEAALAPDAGIALDARREPPRLVRVEEQPGHTSISIRWQARWGVILLGIALVLSALRLPGASQPFDLVLWASHTLPFAYAGVAFLVNHTTLDVDATQVSVRHGPLWWPGAVTAPTAEIGQLRVTQDLAWWSRHRELVYGLKSNRFALLRNHRDRDIPDHVHAVLMDRYLRDAG